MIVKRATNNSMTSPILSLRVRLSEQFAYTHCSGSIVAFRLTQPAQFVRLPATTHELLACFSSSDYIAIREALTILRTSSRSWKAQASIDSALQILRRLLSIGALVSPSKERPIYNCSMGRHYARSRPVPAEVCDEIVRAGCLTGESTVLDVGTGTGAVALHLASTAKEVTGIDISEPLLRLARSTARRKGVAALFVQGCGNKLAFNEKIYDVMTFSQSFHWLDPVWAVLGIYHSLRLNGSAFIIEPQAMLPEQHPLRTMLGYGCRSLKEVEDAWKRRETICSQLFSAAGNSDGVISLAGESRFHHSYRFDIGYAQAFFTSNYLKQAMPREQYPWRRIKEEFGRVSDKSITGDMYWLVLHFRKRTSPIGLPTPKFSLSEVRDIPNAE